MTMYSYLTDEVLAEKLRQTELLDYPYSRKVIFTAIGASILLHAFVFNSHYLAHLFAGFNRFALNGNQSQAPLLIKATLLPKPAMAPTDLVVTPKKETAPALSALPEKPVSHPIQKKKKVTKATTGLSRPAHLRLPKNATLLTREENQFASLKESIPPLEMPPQDPEEDTASTEEKTTLTEEPMDSATETIETSPSNDPGSEAKSSGSESKKITKKSPPASPKTAATLPEQLKLEYQLNKGNGLIMGRANYVLKIDAKAATYELTSTMEASGVFSLFIQGQITQISRGTITTHGFQPDFYQMERQRGPKKTTDSATFQWSTNELQLNTNNELRIAKLTTLSQDYLSFAYQFAFLLPKNQSDYTVPVTNGKKLELYRFEVIGEENLTTPAGEFKTLHLKKQKASENEESTEMWFDLDHHYQLVKLRQTNRQGEVAEQILVKQLQ